MPSVKTSRPLIKLKDLAWLVYLFPARWLAELIPVPWFMALAQAVAAMSPVIPGLPRQRLRERIALAFPGGRDALRLDGLVNQYFRNAILRFFDDLLIPRLRRRRRFPRVDVFHLEHLTNAIAAGKGVMLIGGHFFANRLAKCHLVSIGHPYLSVRNLRPVDDSAGRFGMHFLKSCYLAFLSS